LSFGSYFTIKPFEIRHEITTQILDTNPKLKNHKFTHYKSIDEPKRMKNAFKYFEGQSKN
jgi:hypothetical protein